MFSKFLNFSNRRPIFSLMLGLVFVLFGFFSLHSLTFVRFEKKIYPGIAIRTVANGLDASRVEEEITNPLERIIAQVGGVRKLTSVSEDGNSLIQIQLEENLNLRLKSLEFREKIDTVLSLFPREIHKPQVYRYDPTNSPLMVVSFSKELMSQDELRELVERSFKHELESIDGVSQVILAGGKIREILIACDPKQMEAYSLSLSDVVNKLQDLNQNDSLGKLKDINEEFGLQVREKIKRIIQMRDLPIRVDALSQIVYLKDIAQVSYSPRDDHVAARLNAKDKVSIFIYKNDTSDPISISKKVRQILKTKNILGVSIEFNQDESLVLEETINSLVQLFLILNILLLVYFYFQKDVFRFFITYLISIICAMISLSLFYRVFAFVVSLAGTYGLFLGCLFWYFIRIREIEFINQKLIFKNKYRLNKLNVNFFISSILIIFNTPTIYSFYLTFLVHFVLCFYLLDYFFPVLYVNFLSQIHQDISLNHSMVSRLISRFLLLLNSKGKAHLEKIENTILSDKKILPLTILFLSIAGLYSIYNADIYDNIQTEDQETTAFLEFPSGTSFEHTNQITLQTEKKLLTIPGVKQVVSKIDPGHSLLFIKLEDGIQPDLKMLQTLKSEVGSTEDGFLFFSSEIESSYFQEIIFDVIGYDQKELEKLTQNLSEKVKNFEGVNEAVLRYKHSREELRLVPKYESLVSSNVTMPLFGDELRLALQGGVATKYLDREKEIDVRVRYLEKYRSSKANFSNFRIKNSINKFVPIAELVTTSQDSIPLKYYHKNRNRNLSFSVKIDGNSLSLRKEVIKFVKSNSLPEGYRIEVDEELNQNKIPNCFFIFYPIGFVFLLLLSYSNIHRFIHQTIIYVFPYYITLFLIQFYFPGPLYLPFQIGLLVALPIVEYLVSRKFNLSKYLLYFFLIFYISALILINSNVLGFLHLFSCVMFYYIMVTFHVRLFKRWDLDYKTN